MKRGRGETPRVITPAVGRTGRARSILSLLTTALTLALIACADDATQPTPAPALEPVTVPVVEAQRLLRPRGIVATPDGEVAVIEEGRLTLTIVPSPDELDPSQTTTPRQRRPLRPTELVTTPAGAFGAGAVLVRSDIGYITLLEGLGPVLLRGTRLSDDPPPPLVLGAGSAGQSPAPGLSAGECDLSGARGLAVGPAGRLLIALGSQLLWLDIAASPDNPNDAPLAAVLGADDLTLGQIVGLAVDASGTIYVTVARGDGTLGSVAGSESGLVLAITPSGETSLVAGGGPEFDLPLTPNPAVDYDLLLDVAYLVLDEAADRLLLIETGRILAIDLGAPDGPTLQVLTGRDSTLAGLALVGDDVLVTRANGGIARVGESGFEPLIDATQALALARASSLEAVRTNALVLGDPSQRNVAIWLPGSPAGSLFLNSDPSAPPAAPIASGNDSRIYLHSNLGLLRYDLAIGTIRLVGPSVAAPFAPDQTIHALPLSSYEIVRQGADGELWLLNPGGSFVVGASPTDGSLRLVAGDQTVGSTPFPPDGIDATRLRLDDPTHLAGHGVFVLIADDLGDRGHVIYAVNTSQEPATLFGRDVPAEEAVTLGGTGESAPSDGLALADARFDTISALAFDGARLAIGLEQPTIGLWLVEHDPSADPAGTGRLLELPATGPAPVTAADFAAITPDDAPQSTSSVLVFADATDWIQAENLGDQAVTIADIELASGERQALAHTTSHVVDLGVDADGRVMVAQLDGQIVQAGDGAVSLVGNAVGPVRSLVGLDRGGAVVLDGGLWAVGFDDAELVGEPLPAPPGGRIVAAGGLPRFDTRMAQLAWGRGVLGMVVGDDDSLWWIDGPSRTLRSADPGPDGIGGDSHVSVLTRDLPVSSNGPPYHPMAFGRAEAAIPLFVGLPERVLRIVGDAITVEAGGGDAAPEVGLPAESLALSGISGLAVVADGQIVVRAREGLLWVDLDGLVQRVEPSLRTDVTDAFQLALGDSLATFPDRFGAESLVLVQGGAVYRLVE